MEWLRGMDDPSRQIEAAEGFALLGMHSDAWDTLESLPALCRTLPAVLSVRLLICTGLERWELGVEIARKVLPTHSLPLRAAAGRFHLEHAHVLSRSGNHATARASIAELAKVWPEGRRFVIESDTLAGIW